MRITGLQSTEGVAGDATSEEDTVPDGMTWMGHAAVRRAAAAEKNAVLWISSEVDGSANLTTSTKFDGGMTQPCALPSHVRHMLTHTVFV